VVSISQGEGCSFHRETGEGRGGGRLPAPPQSPPLRRGKVWWYPFRRGRAAPSTVKQERAGVGAACQPPSIPPASQGGGLVVSISQGEGCSLHRETRDQFSQSLLTQRP
jgi:hypothetical protein